MKFKREKRIPKKLMPESGMLRESEAEEDFQEATTFRETEGKLKSKKDLKPEKKKSKKFSGENLPSVEQLKEELHREKYKKRYKRVLKSTVYTLVVVAAVAVLVATIWMPVLQIYGSSMSPTLSEGEIVVTVKTTEFETGDLMCFYMGNKLLVKRYIAGPGQWVDIDEKGNVYVDGELLNEPYVTTKDFGDCNIELPYQVPENRMFCLGDHRKSSLDSRNTAVGCISEEQIVGKIVFRVWPFSKIGTPD